MKNGSASSGPLRGSPTCTGDNAKATPRRRASRRSQARCPYCLRGVVTVFFSNGTFEDRTCAECKGTGSANCDSPTSR